MKNIATAKYLENDLHSTYTLNHELAEAMRR